MHQVHHHLESHRRQYELAEVAGQLGFFSVSVIDDGQGCSGSGSVERIGFSRLLELVFQGAIAGEHGGSGQPLGRRAVKAGSALLGGLMRFGCRGRMMHVLDGGSHRQFSYCECMGAVQQGRRGCLSVLAKTVDAAVSEPPLSALTRVDSTTKN